MIAAVAASVIMGIAVGWVLALSTASTAMSYSQQRMQRRVRYWQAETALARAQAQAERLARKAITQEDPPPGPDDWPRWG